ncbi:hypothetical protein EDB85DRAFT_1957577 [Lactarius pseudohatsudake]|nr:hypothetical protein EDB85DRAFT_1957577 [Lactarius pseudohatsudake]
MVLDLIENAQFSLTLLMTLRWLLLPATECFDQYYMFTAITVRCGVYPRHVHREQRLTRILWQSQGQHFVFRCSSLRTDIRSRVLECDSGGCIMQRCVRKGSLPGDIAMSAVFIDMFKSHCNVPRWPSSTYTSSILPPF